MPDTSPPELPPQELLFLCFRGLPAVEGLCSVQTKGLGQPTCQPEQRPRCLGFHIVQKHEAGHEKRLDGVQIGSTHVSESSPCQIGE